jgi:acetyl esterase
MSFPASFQYAEGDSDDGPDMKLDEDADTYLHNPACPAYFGALLRSLEHAAATGDLGPLIEMRKKDGDSPILDGIASVRGTVAGPAGPLPTLNLWREGADRSKLIQFFFIHGGGWARRTYSAWNIRLSKLILRHDFETISFTYSLSPEAPLGRALDDCFAVYKSLPTDRPIIIAGDSAGGSMAIAIALRAQEESAQKPAGLVLWYPISDMDNLDKYPTASKFESGYGLDLALAKLFVDAYIPNPADRAQTRFTPIYADLSEFPPSLILTAQFDVLRSQALAFAKRLADAGRSVRYRCVPGTIHAFMSRWFERPVAISNEEIENFLKALGLK